MFVAYSFIHVYMYIYYDIQFLTMVTSSDVNGELYEEDNGDNEVCIDTRMP